MTSFRRPYVHTCSVHVPLFRASRHGARTVTEVELPVFVARRYSSYACVARFIYEICGKYKGVGIAKLEKVVHFFSVGGEGLILHGLPHYSIDAVQYSK